MAIHLVYYKYARMNGYSTLLQYIAPGKYIVIKVEYGLQLHYKIFLNKSDRKNNNKSNLSGLDPEGLFTGLAPEAEFLNRAMQAASGGESIRGGSERGVQHPPFSRGGGGTSPGFF